MSMDVEHAKELLECVHDASGPSRHLDGWLWKAVTEKPGQVWSDQFADGVWCLQDAEDTIAYETPPHITSSLDAAVWLVSQALPGWWISGGLCALTGHASAGPDYNGPRRMALMEEWPPDIHDHGNYNADLAPGDGWHRVCYAMLDCMLQALIAKAAGIPVKEA